MKGCWELIGILMKTEIHKFPWNVSEKTLATPLHRCFQSILVKFFLRETWYWFHFMQIAITFSRSDLKQQMFIQYLSFSEI